MTVTRWLALPAMLALFGCAGNEPNAAATSEPQPDIVADANPVPLADPAVTPEPTNMAVRIKPDHPQRYIVTKNDTLWDIAARFLKDPWVWPAIWQANPQIANPHQIYPGDAITLVSMDGKTRLVVARKTRKNSSRGEKTVKLSPEIIKKPLDQQIPAISTDAVNQFLINTEVMTDAEASDLPYVIGDADNRLISRPGDRVYVRDLPVDRQVLYSFFRRDKKLIDPVSGEFLGHQMLFLGNAKLLHNGDPAVVLITDSKREVLQGDLLLPQRVAFASDRLEYLPRAAITDRVGQIVSLFAALRKSARNQVIVVNLGQDERVQVGDVFRVEKYGDTMADYVGAGGEEVRIPDERVGLIMVFSVFERVSYALIMSSTEAFEVGDKVLKP